MLDAPVTPDDNATNFVAKREKYHRLQTFQLLELITQSKNTQRA